uniref:ACB domain-containing protein n=1 Tax=Ascaris lumbricoides TaxID=6252 RepID=A0A0M3HVN8_ASCLU
MDFDVAAEEMRRLAREPTEDEKLHLYGLYKQAIHGNIPPQDDYREYRNRFRNSFITDYFLCKYSQSPIASLLLFLFSHT